MIKTQYQATYRGKDLFRLADGDTLNLLLNSWTILAVAVYEENVGVWLVFRFTCHTTITAVLIKSTSPPSACWFTSRDAQYGFISRYSSFFLPSAIMSNHCLLMVRVNIFFFILTPPPSLLQEYHPRRRNANNVVQHG